MQKLIHQNRVPYGGLYEIRRPEIGMVGLGSTFDQLEMSVRAYRKANGIPSGLGFRDELEQVVCESYPVECTNNDPKSLPGLKRLRLGDVIEGTRVMAKFIASGMKVVSDSEAARRAGVCSSCKYNIHFPKPCGGHCGELKSLVLSLIGNRPTPKSDSLKSCAICACYLEAAVWIPLDIQRAPLSDDKKAQFNQISWCWKNPESDYYKS